MSEPIETTELSDPQAAQVHFLAALPRIERHARVKLQGLKGEALDEAIQKVRGLAWKYYVGQIAKGKNPDEYISAIADFSVKHVRAGRDVTGVERAQDVLSKRAQRDKGFMVQPIPDTDNSEQENESMESIRHSRETPPPVAAEFHHDFPIFIGEMSAKKAAVVLDAAIGDTTTELAEKYAMSQGRVSQIRTEAREKWSDLAVPPAERER